MTAAAGRLLEINPFDEPNVQQAKDATRALLDAYTTRGELPRTPPDRTYDGTEATFSTAARTRLGSHGLDQFLDHR